MHFKIVESSQLIVKLKSMQYLLLIFSPKKLQMDMFFKIFWTYWILAKHFKAQSRYFERAVRLGKILSKELEVPADALSPKERASPFQSKWGNILWNAQLKHSGLPSFISMTPTPCQLRKTGKYRHWNSFSLSLSLSSLSSQHSFSPSPSPALSSFSFPLFHNLKIQLESS